MNFAAMRTGFERMLEAVVVFLIVGMTVIVVAGVIFRYFGSALVWYDEVASVVLVWLTYYGAALAALKGAHIGVPAFVNTLPPRLRVVATLFAEACVFGFFILLAVTGFQVLGVLVGEHLVSLTWVPLWFTQSAVPVGAVLFIIAEALRFPDIMKAARGKGFEDVEFAEAMAAAEETKASLGERRS